MRGRQFAGLGLEPRAPLWRHLGWHRPDCRRRTLNLGRRGGHPVSIRLRLSEPHEGADPGVAHPITTAQTHLTTPPRDDTNAAVTALNARLFVVRSDT